MRRKLGKRLAGIGGLLDMLGAYVLSANEQVAPEPSRLELFLPAVLHTSPSVTRKPDSLTVQRPHYLHPSPAAAADVDLLLSSANESRAFLPPDRTASTTSARNTGDDVESEVALLRYNTALQKELAARCGGTRRGW
ncbi:hypothetical protein EDB85DRAFT_2292482 [Lactarius pseudohatsudake]|nr:hypothetical protein EDB85DRAFT_2292482 [Lactarius pseudohatsudake]